MVQETLGEVAVPSGPLGAAPATTRTATGTTLPPGSGSTTTTTTATTATAAGTPTETDPLAMLGGPAQARRMAEFALAGARSAGATAWAACSSLNASALRGEAARLVDLREYSRPHTVEEATRRLRANLGFFSNTYTAVFGVMALLTVLSNPTLFIAVVLLVAGWSAFVASGDKPLRIGSVELQRSEKLVVLSALTTIVVVFGGLISNVLWVLTSSALIVCAHGVLREPVVLDEFARLEQEGAAIVAAAPAAAAKGGDLV